MHLESTLGGSYAEFIRLRGVRGEAMTTPSGFRFTVPEGTKPMSLQKASLLLTDLVSILKGALDKAKVEPRARVTGTRARQFWHGVVFAWFGNSFKAE